MINTPKAVTILLRASQSISQVIEKDISRYGLNTTEFGTLEYLYHKGNQTIQKVGSKLLMANSSMTYVVDQLEKKDLVQRTKDEVDRRKTVIELTKIGNQLMEKIFPLHEQTLNEVFQVLSEEELHAMLDSLKKLGKFGEQCSTQMK